RAPLRFVDGAKIRLVFVPTKFQLKKQPTFCPLGLFVSKTAYFLSITPQKLNISKRKAIFANGNSQ
ncbi:MAG: hypothetical protein IKG88_00065, partial [Bacteroidales bacterium]|nr:hypothetical protein [Bacteroidales bacterium]